MINSLKRDIAVLMIPVIAAGGLYFAEPAMAGEVETESIIGQDIMNSVKEVMSVNAMGLDEEVETQSFSEKNRKGDPNDPDFGKQWYHNMIHDKEAWKKSTGKGVTVAVIDNGFDVDHPDIAANVKGTYDATGNNDMSPVSGKYAYQGTHAAGVIGAVKDNGIGGCGVAPDSSLYLIKVGDNTDTDSLVRALKKCVEIKANVVNIGVGDYKDSAELKAAVEDAVDNGCVIVSTAGDTYSRNVVYPAAYEDVISVGASSYNDFLGCVFSAYGDGVDIAAPGGAGEDYIHGIYSLNEDGGYTAKYGTALASPMVAGAAALVIGSDKKLMNDHSKKTVEAVRKRILDNEMKVSYFCTLDDTDNAIEGGLDCEGAVKNKVIKRKYFGSRVFRIHAGIYDEQQTVSIGRGKSMNLSLIDTEGNQVSKKDSKGAYTLNTSANGITISNTGRLKVKKNVEVGTKFSVTAQYDGDTFTKNFCVSDPVTKIGVNDGGKIKSSVNVTVSAGTVIKADAPWTIIGEKIYKYSGKSSSENAVKVNYRNGFGDIKLKTSKDQYICYYWVSGVPYQFVAKKGKKYTLTYTSQDGSNKKFKVKIACK
ncbi:MAG: S8 family serine peptidase [Lachnospiraceae bacterium]|nr:S8 family serine peptidase [Lachnospiraceae bacterium]